MIELLVAATISVLLAGLMLTVVVNALNSWNRSHGALEAEAQARYVLDQLTADLQGAMYRNDGGDWLVATVQDDIAVSGLWVPATANAKPSSLDVLDTRTGLAAPGQFADARFGIAGVWLRFITARPVALATAAQPAAPVAVSYQLIRRYPPGSSAAGGETHYLLFRTEVPPAATFATGYNLDPAATPPPAYAATLRQPDALQVIADNVVDFGVRFYSRNSTTGALTLVFPATAGTSAFYAGSNASAFPAVADVMIRVLTAEGVRQIAALEAGQITGDWWTIAAANSKVFTRRIVLNPSPL